MHTTAIFIFHMPSFGLVPTASLYGGRNKVRVLICLCPVPKKSGSYIYKIRKHHDLYLLSEDRVNVKLEVCFDFNFLLI